MANSPKDWVDILAALSTPAIALAIGILTGYIAWRQWRTAELKRKQDLFDKRYAVYEKVLDFLAAINDPKSRPEIIQLLREPVRHAPFLFGRDIREYIDELLREEAILKERIKTESNLSESRQYFSAQYRRSEQLFWTYMKIEDGKLNWHRGLCRVWVIISALWIAGMGWYQYDGWYNNARPVFTDETRKTEFSGFREKNAEFNNLDDRQLADVVYDKYYANDFSKDDYYSRLGLASTYQWWRVIVVFLPPLFIPFIFAIGLWIKRGFKAEAK